MRQPEYEYIRLAFDYGDLSEMNALSSTGWKVIAVTSAGPTVGAEPFKPYYALMERQL